VKQRWALALLFAACGAGTRSPAGAVRALGEAARRGDREAVYRLLAPETRQQLEADQKRAAQLAGRRELGAAELLAAGWFPPRGAPKQVREIQRSGEQATVEVIGAQGSRDLVKCRRVGDRWRVVLEL
jgi:hypothetical protein